MKRRPRLPVIEDLVPTTNPFVSEEQRRACYAKADPAWDCEEWQSRTPRKLPKRKRPTTNAKAAKGSRNLLRTDPSRTLTLRRAFIARLRRQFARLRGSLYTLIVTEDAFGLREARHTLNFDPDQERDEQGRWASGGGTSHTSEAIGFDKNPWEFAKYKGAPNNQQDILDVKGAKAIREQLASQGRLNPDGRTVSLWHVTLNDPDTVESIEKRGMVPAAQDAPGQSWKATHSGYATYFHGDRNAAEANVEQAGTDEHGKPTAVLVEVRVPVTPKSLIRFLPDEDTSLNRKDGIKSLVEGSAVAYIGGVPPSAVRVHKGGMTNNTAGPIPLMLDDFNTMDWAERSRLLTGGPVENSFDPGQERDAQGRWASSLHVGESVPLGDGFRLENQGGYRYKVLTDAGEVALSIGLHKESTDPVASVRDIDVLDSKFRGQGLGRRALQELLKYIPLRSSSFGKTSEDAAKMWKSLGAQEKAGEWKHGDSMFFHPGPTQNAFNPDQPRNSDGKFGSGSASADSHASRILAFARHLPAAAVHKVRDQVSAKYTKLEARYGKGYARAIIGAAMVSLPVPLPGASFASASLVVAVAELHRLAKQHMTRNEWEELLTNVFDPDQLRDEQGRWEGGGVKTLRDFEFQYLAEFKVGGTRFEFEALENRGEWSVVFGVNQDRESARLFTGIRDDKSTSPIKVFSSAAVALGRFIQGKEPKAFRFTADENEPSRVRLYDRFAQKISEQFHYGLSTDQEDLTTGGKAKVYRFTKKEATTNVENEEAMTEDEVQAAARELVDELRGELEGNDGTGLGGRVVWDGVTNEEYFATCERDGNGWCVGGSGSLKPVHLSGDVKKAVDEYQFNSYEINGSLREGIGGAPGVVQRQAIAMKKAFEKSAVVLKQDIVVYRGVDEEDLPKGDLNQDPAFVSTTTDPKTAAFFGDHVMRIRVPAGTKVLPILKGDEKEILLPQWKSFKRGSTSGEVERDGRTSKMIDFVLNLSAADVHAAAQDADPHPTDAQRTAGNYAKGHVTVQGLDITIETAAGVKRRPWHDRPLQHPYGYIKRTRSEADGDHVDVFLGPDPESEVVFVVDQYRVEEDEHLAKLYDQRSDDNFDEHKVIVGFTNADDAKAAYLANYSDDWRGFGGMRALTMPQFKRWLAEGDTKRPIVGQAIMTTNYDEDEPRDEKGQWTTGGATAAGVQASAQDWYHYSKSPGYTSLRSSMGVFGEGVYLTSSSEGETTRTRNNHQYSVKVDVKNPLVTDEIGLREWFKDRGYDFTEMDENKIQSTLWDAGHDSLWLKDAGGPGSKDYLVVFNPEAVKITKHATRNIENEETVHLVGLGRGENSFTANAGRWAFESDPAKLQKFQDWLRSQLQANLRGMSEERLWEEYIQDGFRKGAGRAFEDVNRGRNAGADQRQLDFYAGTKEQFLKSSFGRPETVDKVKLLASRTFDELENVTEDMSNKLSRALVDGLVQGKGPREVADDIDDAVDIGWNRASMIAQTELIRAHAEGQLNALEDMGVAEVGVMVEFEVTQDNVLCDECAALDGIVVTLDEAHGIIPVHVNCRCCFLPANVGEDTDDQTRGKAGIDAAVREARRAGADDLEVDVTRERPTPVVRNEADLLERLDDLLAENEVNPHTTEHP